MFGATISSFILNATLNKHLTQSTYQVSTDILRICTWTISPREQAMMIQQSTITKMPGTRCHRWASISGHGVQRVLVFNFLQPTKDHVLNPSPTKKVLGMFWNIASATLQLLTRRITAHQLKTSSLWKHGPTWLPNRSQWPSWPTTEVLYLSETETSIEGSTAHGSVPVQQQDLHRLDICISEQ